MHRLYKLLLAIFEVIILVGFFLLGGYYALIFILSELGLLFIYFLIIDPRLFIKWRIKSLGEPHVEPHILLEFEHKIRILGVQVLGSIAVLFGLFFTWQSLQISQEGQNTERFTHAVDQLGSDKTSVRIGGLYALQRLAQDSSNKDFLPVVDVVVSYLREHALASDMTLEAKYKYDGNMSNKLDKPSYYNKFILDYENGKFQRRHRVVISGLPLDVFAATSVLKELLQKEKLKASFKENEEFFSHLELNNLNIQKSDLHNIVLNYGDFRSTNLANSNLQNSTFKYADFENAILSRVNIRNSNLEGAILINVDFSEAIISNVNFKNAALWGVDFEGAYLNGANFKNAQLTKAKLNSIKDLKNTNFSGAKLDDTELNGADLSQTIGLTKEQLKVAQYDDKTQLPNYLKRQFIKKIQGE